MDPVVEPSDQNPLHGLSNDVRNRLRMLCKAVPVLTESATARASLVWSHFLQRTAAHLGSSPGQACAGKCFKSDNVRAILLALGIVAFFALASRYGEYRGEQQTSVPGCDSEFCGEPVADATPAPGDSEDTPIIGRVENDDQHRRPAPGTDAHRKPARSAIGNMPGIVTSRKTGARARVGIAHAARFQAYIDDLETNHGARILFMGGIRPGRCSSGRMHPCGRALDVCQLRRGVVDSRCHLPPRRALDKIASAHGLFEGGRWCNSDYGHAQFGLSARDCGDRRIRIVRRQTTPEVAVVSLARSPRGSGR